MAGKGEPKLTDEARAFVVTALACFDPPSVVREALRKEFGVTISAQSVEGYDPTKRAGRNLSVKWKTLFEASRKKFREDISGIGIANKAARLRRLDRLADRAEGQGNIAVAMQALEQAAKEMGDAYTNRREVSGPNGGAVPVVTKIVLCGPDDDGEG